MFKFNHDELFRLVDVDKNGIINFADIKKFI